MWGIFSGALTSAKQWTTTCGQSLLSGYTCMVVLWAMHSALHRAYAASMYNVWATIEVVYALSYLSYDLSQRTESVPQLQGLKFGCWKLLYRKVGHIPIWHSPWKHRCTSLM